MNTFFVHRTRALAILITIVVLGACSETGPDRVRLEPVAFHDSDECHVCGMVITRFPGPKGQAVTQAATRKFCSTAEMLGWWLQPENRHLGAQLFVHDMGRSHWDHPDDEHLIAAAGAWFVAGTPLKGAMGTVLASFADEQAARDLAAEHNARVLRFEEIDLTLLQEGGPVSSGSMQ